jgi:hypothetical protein
MPPTNGARKSRLGSIPASTTESLSSEGMEPKNTGARTRHLPLPFRSPGGIALTQGLGGVAPLVIRRQASGFALKLVSITLQP